MPHLLVPRAAWCSDDPVSDVLAQGPDRPPRRPWLRSVAGVTLVAAVAFVAVRADRAGDSASPPPSTPSASATVDAAPDLAPADGQQPWPTAVAACGGSTELPLLSTAPLRGTTGLKVLVGGAGLRAVDLDTGRVRPYAGIGQDALVLQLAAAAGQVHALRTNCTAIQALGIGAVLRVDVPGRSASVVLPSGTDTLLTAPDATWALRYAGNPSGRQLVLRPLDGGDKVRLPMGFDVAMATQQEFLGNLQRPGAPAPDGGSELAAVSRSDPRQVRALGTGVLLCRDRAVPRHGRGGLRPDRTVRAHPDRHDGGSLRHYPLPAGRAPTSPAVVSPDGRRLVVQVSRQEPDLRSGVGHPGSPSDLAVLDLRSGELTVVPGIELAPKTQAGLAFDRRGRWLVIAVDEGPRVRLLVWRPGMSRPMASKARLPGAVYTVPVLVLDADT